MQQLDNAGFESFRAGLHRDYAPANTQERLLVDEVAACWQRLDQARRRETQFFDPAWIDRPHKAYDQLLRAIRDSGVAFDRAIRRVEQVIARRLTRERADRKEEAKRKPAKIQPQPPAISNHHPQLKLSHDSKGVVPSLEPFKINSARV
jgi:hypothetical protein